MRDNYALRAHLVLDAMQRQPVLRDHAGELALYLEIAWKAAAQHFKSPPVRLRQARDKLSSLIVRLSGPEEACPLSAPDWGVLCAGVVCADGVWQRLPTRQILLVMQQLREAALRRVV